ncbi:oxalate/formate MFS antiporter [Shewanella dokdonensis]|uniref:Oxalate/formate MFS antiporter n=1 Tax=Shewanella dokdonensis TaxID=712036 RepID=A0ABX8DC12_9GAMM|nr:oxalate/formate MFS antiporter [Shewanella dokdonensis]
MDPAVSGLGLYGSYLQPTICLDPADQTHGGQVRCRLARIAGDVFSADYFTNIFSPFQGRLIDYFGPRLLISIGTLLSGMSWILTSQVDSLSMLYLVYGCVGGLGTGIVYVGVVGLMVRWFPHSRGFAAGMVAAGYGMGAIVTTFPISISLKENGLEQTLWMFGILFAVVGFIASQGLKMPSENSNDVAADNSSRILQGKRHYRPTEMLKHPLFWLMFLMMAVMSTSGLMVVSQMATFAADFGITQVTVLGMAALPLAMTIDRFTNGLTRPLFGFVSDRFGRENTMFIAFALEGCAMTLWLVCKDNALLFVLLSGVVFFGWGEIFSLFPSTLTDTFGTRYATANYGWLYTAQGVGSFLGGPLAAMVYQHTGGWNLVFSMAIGADFLTAALALWVLKPWRKRFIEANQH